MVRWHVSFLLLGMLVEVASGFSMQRCVHGISSGNSLRRQPPSVSMIDKYATRWALLRTQAMAAMAAAMVSTSGINLVQPFPAPASAAVVNSESACDSLNGNILKTAFEQAEKLSFSELGWGDAEASVLSRELYTAKGLKKVCAQRPKHPWIRPPLLSL